MRTEWDKNSLQTSLTDDNGNQTQYTYDNLNRRLTETKGICVAPALADRCDPPTTITYEYDPDDNVIRLTDENGSVINSQFDAINRRIVNHITRARGVIGTTAVAYEYDGLSRLTRATDNNDPDDASDDSIITYAYDSLSRVIEETQQIGDLSAKAISTTWRAENLRVGCTYPNNREIAITFDNLDRVDQIADQRPATSDQQPIVDYDYIGKGRVAERRYPINGTRMTYLGDGGTADVGYDGLRRPVKLRHLRADNSLLVGFTHIYDRMNNNLIEEKLHATGDSELYRYDSVYRLIKFERGALNTARDAIGVPSAHTPLHNRWTLDGMGNWQQVDGETRQHSSFNEITERSDGGVTTILSDDNGNETDDGTFIFQWDYKNRLRTVTRKADGAFIAVYAYDAQNRRIRKLVTNSGDLDGTTDFYYDDWKVIEERDGNNILAQQYVIGIHIDEPLVLERNLDGDDNAIGTGDQRLFYHQNIQFSVFAISDVSSNVVEGYHYDAYGGQTIFMPGPNGKVVFGGDDVIVVGGTGNKGNPYMYTGRRLDEETGFHYYRIRYMNTSFGRFIQRDPAGNLDSLNRYEYTASNPVNFTDPYGLQKIPKCPKRCPIRMCRARITTTWKCSCLWTVSFISKLPFSGFFKTRWVGSCTNCRVTQQPYTLGIHCFKDGWNYTKYNIWKTTCKYVCKSFYVRCPVKTRTVRKIEIRVIGKLAPPRNYTFSETKASMACKCQ